MTDALREAAQQALVALVHHTDQTRPIQRTADAIAALRAALSAPAPAPAEAALKQARWEGIQSVQIQTAEIVRAALELLDAAGDTFPPERLAAFQRVFGGAAPAAPAAAPAPAEAVATVTECEACFTPDVCQLRGTCDHYAAERLRVARQEADALAKWGDWTMLPLIATEPMQKAMQRAVMLRKSMNDVWRAAIGEAPESPVSAPDGEPDWSDVRAQAEAATGLKVERHTYSIVIREVRKWLKGAAPAAPAAPAGWQLVQLPVIECTCPAKNMPFGRCCKVPPERETDKWESCRVADFNAGWNACRSAMLAAAPGAQGDA